MAEPLHGPGHQRPFEFGSVPVAPGTLGALDHPRQARGPCPLLAELRTSDEADSATVRLPAGI
jgi:hypothetical protein